MRCTFRLGGSLLFPEQRELGRCDCGSGCTLGLGQAVQQPAELELAEQLDHLLPVQVSHLARFQVQAHRHVVHDSHQVLAQKRLVPSLVQGVAEAAAADRVEVFVDGLYAAVFLE